MIDWQSFSQVCKVTRKIGKLLLVEKKKVHKGRNLSHYLYIIIDKFPNQIFANDIYYEKYYELPNIKEKRYGPSYIYDSNKELKNIYTLKEEDNNNKTMCRTFYPGKTKLHKEVIYTDNNNNTYEEWYENRLLKIKCFKVDGQIHGLYQKYSHIGLLLTEREYNAGKLNGYYKTYRSNGTLRYNCLYKDSKLVKRETYSKKGVLISKKLNIYYIEDFIK